MDTIEMEIQLENEMANGMDNRIIQGNIGEWKRKWRLPCYWGLHRE